MEIISERIRKLRKDLGISQEKIGKMLGAKQASINSYEHSKSAIPTKVLLWYAEFFDVISVFFKRLQLNKFLFDEAREMLKFFY